MPEGLRLILATRPITPTERLTQRNLFCVTGDTFCISWASQQMESCPQEHFSLGTNAALNVASNVAYLLASTCNGLLPEAAYLYRSPLQGDLTDRQQQTHTTGK